jgi:hypothetical protein
VARSRAGEVVQWAVELRLVVHVVRVVRVLWLVLLVWVRVVRMVLPLLGVAVRDVVACTTAGSMVGSTSWSCVCAARRARRTRGGRRSRAAQVVHLVVVVGMAVAAMAVVQEWRVVLQDCRRVRLCLPADSAARSQRQLGR